jgi:hypothetical protein
MITTKRHYSVDRLGLGWKPTKHRFSRFSINFKTVLEDEKKQNELNDDNN